MYRSKKAFRTILLILTAFIVTSPFLEAQMEFMGEPEGISGDKASGIIFITLPDAKVKDISPENSSTDSLRLKYDEFASVEMLKQDPQTAGRWKPTDYGYIWQLGLTARGASSLGVTFAPFRIKKGVRVFVYTANGRLKAGAMNFHNNKETGILPVTSLPGDSIIIEIQTIRDPTDIGEIEIHSVSTGYHFIKGGVDRKDGYYGWSADCHVDINCMSDPEIQLQKYAVCRLIIEDDNIRKRCTGTLLNNTSDDGTPYVLTARHCVNDQLAANKTIFYFDYESPYCSGPDGEMKSISGAYLRSMGELLDFVLLEMSEPPPVDYTPYYSGWSAVDEDPYDTYIIHHPEGDVKKVTLDHDRATTGSYGSFAPNSFWHVVDYEEGSTENGSSGAGLFDRNNQLVGTLTAGGAVCSDPIDDFYQKFSEAWLESEEEDRQLKYWLDPLNTGETSNDGMDPYYALPVLLTNITDSSGITLPEMENGWGHASGHNSLGSVQFAEHYYRPGSHYIFALNLKVGRADIVVSGAETTENTETQPYLVLKIWEGKNQPGNLLFEKPVFRFELEEESDNYIRLDTLILVNENYFVGYEIFYHDPCDTFALYTGIPDTSLTGIPALMKAGQGWNKLNDGTRELDLSLAISPSILYYYPVPGIGPDEYPFDPVAIYPNPSGDDVQILFEEDPEGEVLLHVYDLYGHLVYRHTYVSAEKNIRFETRNILRSGLYFLKIEHNGQTTVKKFLRF